MAPNQKSSSSSSEQQQQQRRRTIRRDFNSFFACFGFGSKASSSSSSRKKKNDGNIKKKRKFLFKLCWPKLKVVSLKRKIFKFDAKTAAFNASHNIILEATKVHHLKKIDNHHHHHHSSKSISQKPNVLLKESDFQDKHIRSIKQSDCATCCKEDDYVTPKLVKSRSFENKVTKDSLLGVLIMVAMLIIMSIWGRLCAILCMAALLYCIPLLQGQHNKKDRDTKDVTTPKQNTNTKSSVDFSSELYKKKVVLQGLLQRDHKNVVGIS